MKTDNIEKFIVDGKVGIVCNGGFVCVDHNSNDYTFKYYDDWDLCMRSSFKLVFDKYIVERLYRLQQETVPPMSGIEKMKICEEIENHIKERYGSCVREFIWYVEKNGVVYTNLEIRFIEVGKRFRIIDYDGWYITQQVSELDSDYDSGDLIHL